MATKIPVNDGVILTVSGLDKLESDLNRAPEAVEAALKKVADDVRDSWKSAAEIVAAVDTYAFVTSIGSHKISAYEFVTDTSDNPQVIYADIIEKGRHDRPSYPARHPAEKALNALDALDWINQRFEEEFDKTFTGS